MLTQDFNIGATASAYDIFKFRQMRHWKHGKLATRAQSFSAIFSVLPKLSDRPLFTASTFVYHTI